MGVSGLAAAASHDVDTVTHHHPVDFAKGEDGDKKSSIFSKALSAFGGGSEAAKAEKAEKDRIKAAERERKKQAAQAARDERDNGGHGPNTGGGGGRVVQTYLEQRALKKAANTTQKVPY